MNDDIQFNIINQDVLKRLRRDGEVHLPEKKLSVPRDERWNMKQMNSRLIRGLELGHSVYDIADSMMDVIGNNEASAIRNARTMVTEAENGGRLDSYRNLESQGVEMVKYWMATADDRVRPSHQDIDGEQKPINEPFSNGCMYPGDNRGPSEEVWMCRCSMGTHVIGFRRADGSISKVDYEPDQTSHEAQMKTKKRARSRANSKYTPLYHGTTFESMVNILKSNELRGNVSNETETYGVSTTRNKATAYDQVRLVLDKELLQETYKVHPVYRESVFGRDLAEERLDKTVTDLSKYVRQIQWNDDSKSNMKIQILRRRLVENFDNPNYTKDPSSDAYQIKQIAELAKKKGIPTDARFKEAVKWIDKFDKRIFDKERYDRMKKNRRK